MAYVTYTTQAIVCGARASNTSDKSYFLFTRQFGMLYATARSVREERSRQRYALQECAIVNVSLVKGKGGWRIGSVEAVAQPFLAATHRPVRAGIVSVLSFLRRFCSGETPYVFIFDDSVRLLQQLHTAPDQVSTLIAVYEFRALADLGYIAVPEPLREMLREHVWSNAVLLEPIYTQQLDPFIERGKQASHL